MKNEKGFTLVEVLAVIAILGILLTIAVPAVSKYLAKFRLQYYEKLEDSVNAAGQEYFDDKRFSRPTEILQAKKYEVKVLEDKNIIEPVVDYRGKACTGSYFIAVKTGKNEYAYASCLKCAENDYATSTKGKDMDLCNPAWLDNTNIEIKTIPDSVDTSFKYYYYTTHQEEILDDLSINYSVTKRSNDGTELKTVNNAGEGLLYPSNIGQLVVGNVNNKVDLIYNLPDGTEIHRPAVMYKLEEPKVTISGTKVTVTFNDHDSKDLIAMDKFKMKKVEYYDAATREWYNTGCSISNNICTWNINSSFNNKNLRFRITNNNGDVSDETKIYTIKLS